MSRPRLGQGHRPPGSGSDRDSGRVKGRSRRAPPSRSAPPLRLYLRLPLPPSRGWTTPSAAASALPSSSTARACGCSASCNSLTRGRLSPARRSPLILAATRSAFGSSSGRSVVPPASIFRRQKRARPPLGLEPRATSGRAQLPPLCRYCRYASVNSAPKMTEKAWRSSETFS